MKKQSKPSGMVMALIQIGMLLFVEPGSEPCSLKPQYQSAAAQIWLTPCMSAARYTHVLAPPPDSSPKLELKKTAVTASARPRRRLRSTYGIQRRRRTSSCKPPQE